MTDRIYYRTEQEANEFLEREGFALYNTNPYYEQYPWRSETEQADLRFNSKGYWIERRPTQY